MAEKSIEELADEDEGRPPGQIPVDTVSAHVRMAMANQGDTLLTYRCAKADAIDIENAVAKLAKGEGIERPAALAKLVRAGAAAM